MFRSIIFLTLAFFAIQPAIADEFVMHRKEVSGEKIGAYYVAKSTLGGYEVQIPTVFNDHSGFNDIGTARERVGHHIGSNIKFNDGGYVIILIKREVFKYPLQAKIAFDGFKAKSEIHQEKKAADVFSSFLRKIDHPSVIVVTNNEAFTLTRHILLDGELVTLFVGVPESQRDVFLDVGVRIFDTFKITDKKAPYRIK